MQKIDAVKDQLMIEEICQISAEIPLDVPRSGGNRDIRRSDGANLYGNKSIENYWFATFGFEL